MAYYNEIFIQKEYNGDLEHIASCTGSDTPCYFHNVKTEKDFYNVLRDLKSKGGYWKHSNKHPFPWSTYKTSDNIIVLVKNRRYWFEFWKPKNIAMVSVDKGKYSDNECVFAPAKLWRGDIFYPKSELKTIVLPKLVKN